MMRNVFLLIGALLAVWTGTVRADEASVRQALETRLGVKVDEIAKTPYSVLYEVRLGDEIGYTDEKANFLLVGSLVDTKTRENLTEARREKLSAIRFEDLPLDRAIKTVRGNGRSTMAVFADPNCGFCKRMERDLSNMSDVTIYTFLYPILDGPTKGDSMKKSQAIWCAKDRSKAWFDLMLKDVQPVATGSCDTSALQRNLELGEKLSIRGTPTTFMRTGQRIIGARTADVRKAVETAKN